MPRISKRKEESEGAGTSKRDWSSRGKVSRLGSKAAEKIHVQEIVADKKGGPNISFPWIRFPLFFDLTYANFPKAFFHKFCELSYWKCKAKVGADKSATSPPKPKKHLPEPNLLLLP
jgi:hypothetical protein